MKIAKNRINRVVIDRIINGETDRPNIIEIMTNDIKRASSITDPPQTEDAALFRTLGMRLNASGLVEAAETGYARTINSSPWKQRLITVPTATMSTTFGHQANKNDKDGSPTPRRERQLQPDSDVLAAMRMNEETERDTEMTDLGGERIETASERPSWSPLIPPPQPPAPPAVTPPPPPLHHHLQILIILARITSTFVKKRSK